MSDAEAAQAQPEAARRLSRPRGRGLRAGRDGHRSGVRHSEAARAPRPQARRHRPDRAERGLRVADRLLPRSARPRSREAQRERRRDLDRAPVRHDRRAAGRRDPARAAPAARRSGASSRCASAAAWAPRGCSKLSRSYWAGVAGIVTNTSASFPVPPKTPSSPVVPIVTVSPRSRYSYRRPQGSKKRGSGRFPVRRQTSRSG